MRRILIKVLGAMALVVAPAASAAVPFDIAITLDDFSGNGALPPNTTRLGIAQAHLDILKAHHVPEVYGFVNASLLTSQPGGDAVLDAWRQADYPLGNHTYSHMSLDKASSLEAWEADVVAGEPEVAKRMQNADWHYLRYPFLTAGTDQARHDGALTFLKARGYRIADVSVSFNDWAYSDAYARCLAKGDMATIDAMKVQYFKGVDDGIARMQALSQRVYGRMVPQVLLAHLSGWSAVTMPEVLKRLEAAGGHYVGLSQAEADPAYAETDPRAGDQVLMDRTAREKGINISDIPYQQSIGNIDGLCR